MIFKQLAIGGDRNFAYLIGDPASRRAAVVDPGRNGEMILAEAEALGLDIIYIINTHSHYDHTGANREIKAQTGADIVGYHATGVDKPVQDGDELRLGQTRLSIIHTPGHTPDCICILAEGKLCTGDTLFVGKVGGTGFGDDARQEYDSLHNKLLALPDDTEVFPGHDYGVAPVSTIGHERQTNPFLLQPDFASFVQLKRNWPTYKRQHGIK